MGFNIDPYLRHVGLRVDTPNPLTIPLLVLASIGALSVGSFFLRFARVLADVYALPGISLSKFGAKKGGSGSWALVTGATDGIGREFALQLAGKGFNILLASRTLEKLGKVAGEIESAYPGVQTKCQAIDFALGDEKQYAALEDVVRGLDIGVLVNNVGKSHDMPVPFAETSPEELEDIVEINVAATLRVSRMVVPGMVERRRGLILNMGSFAGLASTPLLATYSGTKAFLAGWSQALGEELRRSNVHVELVNTYFVVSAMSKIRRASAMVPTPRQYVKQTLATIGNAGGAVGRPYTSTPWPLHAIVDWAMSYVLPKSWLLSYQYDMQVQTRKRAIRKQERALKAQ